MPKKRKRKKTGRSKRPAHQRNRDQSLTLVETRVTYAPMPNEDFLALPSEVQDQVNNLYHHANSDPQQVIRELSPLKEKYPHVAILYNHLARAYSLLRDYENAEKIILEQYRKFPDYLFARINYAQLCLTKKELEKIPDIFDKKFVLKLLYPERAVFHISEIVNFNSIVGEYFVRIGNMISAKALYQELKYFAPDDPMTRRLERLLSPSLFIDRIKATVMKETR